MLNILRVNNILMTIISRHINTVLLPTCQTQVLILHFFIFPTAQQGEGEGSADRDADDSHQDFSLSRVRDLRKMVHKAVMKNGNVFILSVVLTFFSTQSFIPSHPL